MLSVVCFCIIGLNILVAADGARQAAPMKTYKVDLNDPPQTRWNHVLEPYLPSIPLVMDYFNSLIPVKELTPLLEAVMADLDKYLGEYGQEIRGIADYANIDLGMLVGLNLAYELRRIGGGHPNITGGTISSDEYVFGCTSIVAKNKDGHIYHGRNMDWNIPNNIRNMTVEIMYYRGDKFLFKGVTTVGYVGIITGASPNGFSASINERDLGGSILVDALEALTINQSKLPTHLLRETLEVASSYEDAHERLSSARLIAPVYYIMAGTTGNQGAIMSHDRNSNTREQTLGSATYSDWYLMETNYDYWKSPPTEDDRRSYAHRYIQSKGQDSVASEEGILSILSEWPVWNRFTAYTATMDPSTGELKGYDIYDV